MRRRIEGQASLEMLGGVLALLLCGVIAFQLLGAGYAVVMADHAAEAAALAIASGGSPQEAAASAVPGWPRRALSVQVEGARVRVRLDPPSALGLLRGRLSAQAEAALGGREREPAG